jgi:cephalosporin-C deacetylase
MFAESTETTLWEAAYTGEIEINNSQIATFQAGDVLRVYLTVPDNGGNFCICYKGVSNNWAQQAIPSVGNQWPWVYGTNTFEVTFTQADLDSIADRNIYLYEGTCNITRITHVTLAAGQNQTIWTGNKDFGTAWSAWEPLPASTFVNAVEGQLLRFRFTDLRAGAQLKVSKGDWSDMPDTEIAAISGRYQDFSVTANNLTELQANGAIISGLGFTLTEVQLLDPASLRPLMLSVPVTDNWIFNGKPSITIHVENPYTEAVTANAEVQIATDKMAAVTTLYQSVKVPAGSSQDIVLTTAENLVPGFYKATCIVNDDLARAFVFGVNPFDIVSAPDKQPDFDTFWAAAKAELAQVPMNATLTEITAKSTAARKVYLVEMQSIADTVGGAPVIVRGYYCEPQDGQQHPVIMHYLGYDSGYRPGGQDVMPYCPSGDAEPAYAEFYLSTRGQSINNRAAGEREPDGKGDFTNIYGDWFAYHFGDKDCYYYRGAFMDCVRAIQFMASRSTSDMTNLFAEGQSQGGAFTYAAASLTDHPFKAIAPAIAFLGDYPDYFDIVSWPAYVARDNQGTMTDAQMFAFLSYFDTKNLATSISCPTIACIGLQDNICPPHTNIAPYNNLLSTDKQMLFNPELMHQASSTWYADFMAFFASHIMTNPSALEQTNTGVCNTQKMICDGQLILLRDGQAYNAIGQIITH